MSSTIKTTDWGEGNPQPPANNKTVAEQHLEEFVAKYITSGEIVTTLGINRSTVFYARRNGHLPNAMEVPGVSGYIWLRAPLQPHLDAWKASLDRRRGLIK